MRTVRHCLLLLIFFLPLIIFSQNNYFVKDTVTAIGAALVDGNSKTNQKVCKVRKGNTILEYTPWQVSEYGYDDGRAYIAREITLPDSTRKVFLERLVKGKYNLYYYEGQAGTTFFLERDTTLFVELPKHDKSTGHNNFREDLSRYTADCPQMADAIKLVRYNRAGYKKFMNRYEKCRKRPFPFFRFGITAGYSACRLIPKPSISIPEINELDYSNDGGFAAGLFLESPVLLSDISIFVELLFTQHEVSGNKTIRYEEVDFYGKMSSLQLPVLLRYSFPSNRIRPFVNAGGVLLYNFSTEEHLYHATNYQHVVEIGDERETSLIKQLMPGYSLGGGVAVQLRPRNWISVDVRYNHYYALQSSQAMDISEIQLTTRVSF
jgi:hypothetical protein